MKTLSRIGMVIVFFVCSIMITVRVNAAEESTVSNGVSYTVAFENAEYVAYSNTSSSTQPIFVSDKLQEVIEYISSISTEASINFSSVVCEQDINFCGVRYTIEGKLEMCGDASITIEGADINAENLMLNFEFGALRLKKGSVNINNSEISAKSVAVKMDYSSNSTLEMHSGRIGTSTDKEAIDLKYGTLKVSGGTLENSGGPVIKNSATLILSGDAVVKGVGCEIYSSSPITLSDDGVSYCGKIRVKYFEDFEKGKVSIVAYGASEENEGTVTLIDSNGKEIALKYYESYSGISEKRFLSAYIPYKITFAGDIGQEIYCLSGEGIKFPDVPIVDGYTFLGWKCTVEDDKLYESSSEIFDDLVLYPSYKLSAPTFSITSLEFVYDGNERYLSVSELAHPLLDEGIVTFQWYKDGQEIFQYTDKIPIEKVLDTGKYQCIFTFSHKSDSVTVQTPPINVTVHKKEIKIPSVDSVKYNGEVRYPQIYSISLYEVESISGTNAGIYPFKIKLRDPENYKFENTDSAFVTVDFVIEKAENQWIEEPAVKDVYDFETVSITATSKFGSPIFLYSKNKEGPFTEDIPKSAGKYFIKAEVSENTNYYALSYEPIAFNIMEDEILSLHIVSHADKRSYVAFEYFSKEGLAVAVGYRSGRKEVLDSKKLEISYNNGSVILFGDSSVSISYNGKTILYPIEVSKAEYDLSEVFFANFEYEYSAQFISPEFKGDLPVGKDGISLGAKVVGGGTSVGTYVVELSFFTDSPNYIPPESMKAVLNITPKTVEVIWEDLSFVYDGQAKAPKASYFDILDRRIYLKVNGVYSYAGKYNVSVTIDDKNYVARNAFSEFEILKADYDLSGVYWSERELVYNGEEQRVFLMGLPDGVSVIGYSDNRAEKVGKYLALVTLDYDNKNYNSPNLEPYEWRITQAEYDLSTFHFSDAEYVYDGEAHVPLFYGELPIGIDGSVLNFRYCGSVSEVSSGKTGVSIEFYTDSPNYKVPPAKEYFVTILPKGISVDWSNLQFVYNEELFSPIASAAECEITVIGASKNAGKHIAQARTLNSNYYVVNNECEFEILKAENKWEILPKISNIYTSGLLLPEGKVKYGDTEYVYSLDKTRIIESPKFAGVFYFKASSLGDENHLPIESEWIEFEIIDVIALEMTVELLHLDFLTLSKISDSDVEISILNNDSSIVKIPLDAVSVCYSNGECINIGDTSVKFSYLGFEAVKEIRVLKRDYDLSMVCWEGVHSVYNGEAKNAFLTGLPDGVSVVKYIGNGAVNAGLYVVSAHLLYDEINYNEPVVPDAVMTIEKQVVVIPDIASVEYNANTLFPNVMPSDLYNYSFEGAKAVGVYTLLFTLNDSHNYCFEGGTQFFEKQFEIKRSKLTVQICDINSYYFGKYSEPSYTILSGQIFEGENIFPVYEIGHETVFASFEEGNYEIEVYPGKVIKCNRLSDEDTKIFLLSLFIIIVGSVCVTVIIINRRRILAFYRRASFRKDEFIPSIPVVAKENENSDYGAAPLIEKDRIVEEETEIRNSSIQEDADSLREDLQEDKTQTDTEKNFLDSSAEAVESEISFEESIVSVIDAAYADSVITDSLAKDLIRKDSVIETDGNKKKIINVDTLSRSFSSGERVDINLLKGKKLIPYDTGYIKVLARGIIDKPLDVYANDFSLSAVKMIALSGGKSIKANTVPVSRKRENADFKKKT